MKKIAIVLANEIKDSDLFIPLYIWRKAKTVIDLISIEKKNSIITESGVKVGCTSTIDNVNISQYHALYIPGGKGVLRFKHDNWPTKSTIGLTKLIKAVESFTIDKSKLLLLASDAAPVLEDYHLWDDARIAGYNDDHKRKADVYEEIVIDSSLISFIGHYQLSQFAFEVLEILFNDKIRKQIEKELDHN